MVRPLWNAASMSHHVEGPAAHEFSSRNVSEQAVLREVTSKVMAPRHQQ